MLALAPFFVVSCMGELCGLSFFKDVIEGRDAEEAVPQNGQISSSIPSAKQFEQTLIEIGFSL